jgi:hypothetical protein
MPKIPNPLDDEPDSPEEAILTVFATFLEERSKVMGANKTKFPSLPSHDYLMDEISALLGEPEWDREDMSRLCALFFCLLALPEEPPL